jgi:YD repeat-containing protein
MKVYDVLDKGVLLDVTENNPRASYIKEWALKDFDAEDAIRNNLPSNIPEDALVKFSVTNESGITYTYGQPVFIRNESNLTIDIDKTQNLVKDNFLAFKELPLIKHESKYVIKGDELLSDNLKTVIGEVKSDEYAVIYLLTSITGGDYIDVDQDGITSENDFGSWTRFNYSREYGGDGDWYRFRTPYAGFFYEKGMLSDKKDDAGAVYTGEKEIYYLESIETKSHIAWFVTNQYVNNSEYNFDNGVNAEREDGLSAPDLGALDPASYSENIEKSSLSRLKYLDRIELFSKNRPDKAIKTICFGYDYSLVNNIPNSTTGKGKLTLKKLWFQYEGKKPVKVSPYEFEYDYEASSYFQTGREYFAETDHYSSYAQNPDYEPHLIDPWGYQMPYAKERKSYNIPYIYQGNLPAGKIEGNPYDWRSKLNTVEVDYDPAAWNLKQIILPSGGEVHVQYEQKDYRYVQDRDVMAMVSLLPENINSSSSFHLNLDDLGIDPTNAQEIKEQVDKINATCSGKKIYFKFLYSLGFGSADLENGQSEYIDGYATFAKATSEQDGGNYSIAINLSEELPREACIDFYKANRQGMMNQAGAQKLYVDFVEPGVVNYVNANQDDTPDGAQAGTLLDKAMVRGVAIAAMAAIETDRFLPSQLKRLRPDADDFGHNRVCNELNPNLSFFKIPMIKAKRGGGARVKQVLLYDKGIKNNAPVVYGNRYHYVLKDGVTSSGVASNEPSAAREENPLVRYLPRESQSIFSRLTVGEDIKQTEGPLGESLLPGAFVIHSRVVVENIHTGKTGSGFTVSEFYTSKDYPYDRYYKEIKDEDGTTVLSDATGKADAYTPLMQVPDKFVLPTPLLSFSFENISMSQGSRFIVNSMNGVKKGNSVYGGNYNTEEEGTDTKNAYLIASTSYEYFNPGEKVKMLSWNGTTYTSEFKIPGKEVDIAIEKKRLKDVTTDFSIEIDPSAGTSFLPPIFLTFVPSFSLNRSIVATHSTTKVISYPTIPKKTIVFQEGMISEQENIAFDAMTGKPLVVRNTDSYTGIEQPDGSKNDFAYYNFSVPAHWIYEGMGQKAVVSNSNTRSNQLSAPFMNLTTYGEESEALPQAGWLNRNGDVLEFDANHALSASIQTYKSDWTASSWTDSKISSKYEIADNHISLLNQVMRPWTSYSYVRDNELPSYDNGTFDIENITFNLNHIQQSDSWLRGTTITKYSPNGNPLEEYNAQGIYSAVTYNQYKDFMVPSMVASNARYENIHFASFEGNGNKVSSTESHSGDKSVIIGSADNILSSNVRVTDHLKQKGAYLQLWILNSRYNGLKSSPSGDFSSLFSHNVIARVDNWNLVKIDIGSDYFAQKNIGDVVEVYIRSNSPNIVADDIKFQPKDAQASCFVYDEALRLIAQFDDQHFGTYYQYNEEGKLVRKVIETERGKKTIQETEYNIPKKLK